MERLYITHYYYPGTDPWKNIMLLPEDEAFRVAGELAEAHPETTSFGRFADFRNYYPARKKADEYVRARFVALGGNPILAHPYSFTLMECEYLRKWFSNGEKLVLNLDNIPDDQISFTIGDSCAQITNGTEPEVLTKDMLMRRIHDCGDSVNSFLEGSLGKFAYVEVQLWYRPILTAENNNDKKNKTSQYYSITLSERKSEDMGKTERSVPTHIVAAAGIVVNSSGEILLVKNNRRGWEFPGGQVEVGENVIDAVKREIMEEAGVEIEVGEVFCISSNTCKYPGYNGIKEVPTKIMLDFICHAKEGTPRPSEENTASDFFPKDVVLELIQSPAYIERFKAFMNYTGRPTYLEYVTKPEFQLKINRLI